MAYDTINDILDYLKVWEYATREKINELLIDEFR